MSDDHTQEAWAEALRLAEQQADTAVVACHNHLVNQYLALVDIETSPGADVRAPAVHERVAQAEEGLRRAVARRDRVRAMGQSN